MSGWMHWRITWLCPGFPPAVITGRSTVILSAKTFYGSYFTGDTVFILLIFVRGCVIKWFNSPTHVGHILCGSLIKHDQLYDAMAVKKFRCTDVVFAVQVSCRVLASVSHRCRTGAAKKNSVSLALADEQRKGICNSLLYNILHFIFFISKMKINILIILYRSIFLYSLSMALSSITNMFYIGTILKLLNYIFVY